MRITIVMPFLNLTGGNRLLFDYANNLHRFGHQVTVVHPFWPYRFQYSRVRQLRMFARHLLEGNRVNWYPLVVPLVRVPLIREEVLPDADVVVAHTWTTAHDIAGLSLAKGTKIYFLMHYEIDSGPKDRVDGSYRLPLYRLTISERTRQDIQERFGCTVAEVIPCGVDPAVFYKADSVATPFTVAMPYHRDPRKGAEDGLVALGLVHDRLPGLRVRLFGHRPPAHLPGWIEFHTRPTDSQLRALYAGSTALLYPSRDEGFGLPPLEAMACGCPVASTRVGAVPEYAVDGWNALLANIGDIQAMAGNLERLLTDRLLRERLVGNGLVCATQRSVEQSARNFERALERVLHGEPS